MSEQPTPDTDALISKAGFGTTAWEWRQHSRRLERERNEAREDAINLRRMSVVELMGENLNVKHHVTEWENRCLKTERERDEALELLASEKITRNHIINRSVEVERERDEARETLEYIACAGLSARHIEDYVGEFLKRLEVAK